MRAVELPRTEVARQQRDPRAAQEAARVAHRVVAVVAGPVRHRRAVDHERPGHVGTRGREHHHRPSALAVADQRGLRALPVAVRDDPHEFRLRVGDVGERLARLGLREEDHEVDGVARGQRHADLRVLLEPTDAGAMARPRVDDDERPLALVDLHSARRNDADECVVARPVVSARVRHDLVTVVQERRLAGLLVRQPLVAALADRVPEERRALSGVDEVLEPVRPPLLRVGAGETGLDEVGLRLAHALAVRRVRILHASRKRSRDAARDRHRPVDRLVDVGHRGRCLRIGPCAMRAGRRQGRAAAICCAATKLTLPQSAGRLRSEESRSGGRVAGAVAGWPQRPSQAITAFSTSRFGGTNPL